MVARKEKQRKWQALAPQTRRRFIEMQAGDGLQGGQRHNR